MLQSFAATQRKQSDAHASGMGAKEDVLASAGVYVVHACAGRIEDPAGVLARWQDDGSAFSFRHALRQLDNGARSALLAAMRKAKSNGTGSCEISFSSGDERLRWFRVHLTYGSAAQSDAQSAGGQSAESQSAQNQAARWDIVFIDITREHAGAERLKLEAEHLYNVVDYNPQLPWIADANGRLIDFADHWVQAIGLPDGRNAREDWASICHPADLERVDKAIDEARETRQPFDFTARRLVHGEYRWMRARGYPRLDGAGNIMCWYGYSEDVHEKVLIDQQICWDAEHDALTGLYNRAYFSLALGDALSTATTAFRKVALILIDLDNFKDVNDSGGHGAGDVLLGKFADYLTESAPHGAMIARFGGDEFAVLLEGLTDESQAISLAQAIVGEEGEFKFGGRAFTYHASAGVGIFPDHGINANQLLRHTELALYSAKSKGRSQLQVFEKSMLADMHERLAMVNRARVAAKGHRIFAYYQPKVCLKTGALASFEALLRWQDGSGRIHPPATIYAAFEEKSVADMLGKAMIHQVMEDIARWKAAGLPFHSVAINASPAEMRHKAFVDNLIEGMEAHGISNDEIEVEITEGVFLGANADASRQSIQKMNERGIALALDDFGTGYASLSHLRNLPISTLKIDRSFVSDISGSNSDHAIVAGIVSMGRAMGLRVVAEGIENATQERLLKELSCEYGQGFYFSTPVPAREVPDLIRYWDTRKGLGPHVAGAGRQSRRHPFHGNRKTA